jgi:serine/threonine protein kinase
MSLPSGTKLGPYEVVGPLGAGGMGEVYRATDSRLGRDVALKFLPEAFAREAERMARFEREAKVLASLNHPAASLRTTRVLYPRTARHARRSDGGAEARIARTSGLFASTPSSWPNRKV